MVLAAGLGRRLMPLTEQTPKPLIKVNGKALIDYALDLVRGAGIGEVVVNCHHLGDQVEAHVNAINDLQITLSDERGELLETGGGVQKALPNLGTSPFAVLNADVIVRDGKDSSLKNLMTAWDPERMDVLLLMQRTQDAVGYQGKGDYNMDERGRLTRRDEREMAPFLYAGVQIVNPNLFEGIDRGAFSLNRIFDRAEARGRLFGLPHNGQWLHVGDPEALQQAEKIIQGT